MKHNSPSSSFLHKALRWFSALVLVALAPSLLAWTGVAEPTTLSWVPSALAQEGGIFNSIGQGAGTLIAGIATIFIKLLAGILWFVIYWMGDLMDNTFILEGEIGEKLRSVWVIVRNFVNIFFALALVVVALLSVVGYGDDSGDYSLKKFIPRMALALVAVNFTFLAARLVLDVNNVLTTAVFAIPQNVSTATQITSGGSTAGVDIFKKFRCLDSNKKLEDSLKDSEALNRRFPGVINQLGGICFANPIPAEGVQAAQLKDPALRDDPNAQAIVPLGTSQFNKNDFAWTMVTQFQGLHDLNKVSVLVDESFSGLTVNALFSLVFALVYGTAYVAMFIILVTRVAVLWITIMLSPIIAIKIAMPSILPDELDIQQKFLDYAFIPLRIAVPLSFGYILLSQMVVAIDTDSNIIADKVIDLSEGGDFARGINFNSLMYGAMSVAVVWMGVFSAVEKGDITGLAGKLGETVKNAGRTISKWPTYIPFIPLSGGTASLSTLTTGVTEISHQMEQIRRSRDRGIIERQLAQMGIANPEVAQAMDDLRRMISNGEFRRDQGRQRVQQILQHPDQRASNNLIRELATKDDWTPESQRYLARAFGYAETADGFRQLQEHVRTENFAEIRRRGGAGGGGSNDNPSSFNYAGISSGNLQYGTPNGHLVDLSGGAGTAGDEIRSGISNEVLGRWNIDQAQGGEFNIRGTNFNQFMTDIKDTSAVNNRAFGYFLDQGLFERLAANNTNLRQQWVNDTGFVNRLTSLLNNTGTNEANTRNGNIIRACMRIRNARNYAALQTAMPGVFDNFNENGTPTNP